MRNLLRSLPERVARQGSRVATQLQNQGYPVRLAGRKLPSSTDSRGNDVYFDWYNPATYGAALKGINHIYLVVPQMDINQRR